MSNFVKIYRRDVINYLRSEYQKRKDDRERAVSRLTGILSYYDKDLAKKINNESLFFGWRYYSTMDALYERKLNKRHEAEVNDLDRSVWELTIELELLDKTIDRVYRMKDPDRKKKN